MQPAAAETCSSISAPSPLKRTRVEQQAGSAALVQGDGVDLATHLQVEMQMQNISGLSARRCWPNYMNKQLQQQLPAAAQVQHGQSVTKSADRCLQSTCSPCLDGASAAVVDVHRLLGVGLVDHNLAVAHLHDRQGSKQRLNVSTPPKRGIRRKWMLETPGMYPTPAMA